MNVSSVGDVVYVINVRLGIGIRSCNLQSRVLLTQQGLLSVHSYGDSVEGDFRVFGGSRGFFWGEVLCVEGVLVTE